MNKYVGSRYVPIYIGIHDETIEYEPLSIVSNTEKTETYTSKQHVPKGVSLDNETYWVQSGFSNADLQIDVDSAGYLSTDSSDLEIEKTKGGYLITLNASNSFDCGGEFGEAYTLNTLYDVGRYVINPSLCTGIPSELENISNPAELVISEYTKKDEEIFYQYQKITAYDSDNAASFIRFHDGKNWSDWKMIGGNGGGSYTLPVASANTLGGVKIGSGINVTDDGTISVSGGGGSASGEWIDITSKFNGANLTVTKALANTVSKEVIVRFKLNEQVSLTSNTATDLSQKGFDIPFTNVIEAGNSTNPVYVLVGNGYSDGKRMCIIEGRFLRTGTSSANPNFYLFGGYALGNDVTLNTNTEMFISFHVDEEITA